MEIKLTHQESEEFFYNALCNGLGYVTSGYGLEFDYSSKEYQKAKEKYIEISNGNPPCFEDVLMQILRDGGRLSLIDVEGNDEKHTIRIRHVHERVQLTGAQHLLDMVNDNDDAVTADCIIQMVFFNEIVYG